MPRKARIDAPGALHHIIVRGIARRRIFDDNKDRDFFIERFSLIINESQTLCFAWALIPNHFHLLLKTGVTPIATVMKRLLTGYAMYFNRRHQRQGHLFQNRYKSILCQEDRYFLELVRYIHLNPIRAGLVPDMKALREYPYSGHRNIMNATDTIWQDTDYVLRLFGETESKAKNRYHDFVSKGISEGKREDLIGGGLVRSSGGWDEVKLLRKAGALQKGDERILGDGEFVEKTLAQAKEIFERKYHLQASGMTLNAIAERVATLFSIRPEQVWESGRQRNLVHARSLLCYWAVTQLGISQVQLGEKLGLTSGAVSQSVARGREIAVRGDYKL